MSIPKKVLLILGLVCLIPLSVFGISMSLDIYRWIFSPYLDQDVTGPVTLSPEWQDIVPREPLRAERQIQYVILTFAEPFEPNYKGDRGLRLSDGSVVVPEVQLVDQYGNIFNLHSPALDHTGMGFTSENALPKDRTYRTVRIRSNKPIKVSRIYWHCYNSWDVS